MRAFTMAMPLFAKLSTPKNAAKSLAAFLLPIKRGGLREKCGVHPEVDNRN